MADFLNYNSLSKDPVAMEEELNKVQMKLREEQLARHKLEGEMERIRRHNKHLQYNLKRLKIATTWPSARLPSLRPYEMRATKPTSLENGTLEKPGISQRTKDSISTLVAMPVAALREATMPLGKTQNW